VENLTNPEIRSRYSGPVTVDPYGRRIPKHSHGTIGLGRMTSSSRLIAGAMLELFDRIANPDLLVRRINIVAGRVLDENDPSLRPGFEQLDLFTDYAAEMCRREEEAQMFQRERRRQEAVLQIRKRYGKNAILRGMSLQEGATARDRNRQIGGHRA
jgi:DNA polymerase V